MIPGWTVNRLSKGSRQEWLALRQDDLTASEAGALFGVHKYTTARKLAHDKAYGEVQDRSNAVLRRGQVMEPAVAEAIVIDTPLRPRRCEHYLRARANDPYVRMGATMDYDLHVLADELVHCPQTRAGALAAGWDQRLGETLYLSIECKSVDSSVFEREWSAGPPPYHLIQVAQQALLAGADGGLVACLVENFTKDLFLYPVPRRPDFEMRLIEEARAFWGRFETGEEAPLVALDNSFMATYFPPIENEKAPAATVNLSAEPWWQDLVGERERLTMAIEVAEKRIDEIEAQLKDRMREAVRAILPGWVITWKADKTGKRSLRIKRDTRR
jgi:predicted phage-related endonuclease